MNSMHLSSVQDYSSAHGSYTDLIAMPEATLRLKKLSPRFRDLITTASSARNQTPLCATTHVAVTAEMLGNQEIVESVMRDPQRTPLCPNERTLLANGERLNRAWRTIVLNDSPAMQAPGWRDEAVYDALPARALFDFYNCWFAETGYLKMDTAAALNSTGR